MTEVTIKIRMKDFSTDTIADIAKAVKKIGDGATLSHIHTQELAEVQRGIFGGQLTDDQEAQINTALLSR